MKIIRTASVMQKTVLKLKKTKTIALVPTMGFLHEGHLSLVKKAKSSADCVIVSIFVNPTQFAKNEDLSTYPRDLKGDLKKLKSMNVDFVFLPNSDTMYPKNFQTTIHLDELPKPLCGKFRPTHFDGVATVVAKLFLITQPNIAVFGKKDYQQFLIIKQLIKDLNFPIKLIGAPILREKSGLAMSSRNKYLSANEKITAAGISKSLRNIKNACQNGLSDIDKIKKMFRSAFTKNSKTNIQYIECLDRFALTPLKKIKKGKTLIAVAVYVGSTRLIDNIEI